MPGFADMLSLNAWLEAHCIKRWSEIPHGVLQGSVADVHAQERPSLMPLERPFDGFVEHTKRVSPICLVHFEANRYSVPASFANQPVSLRVYPKRLVVVAEGQVRSIAYHTKAVQFPAYKDLATFDFAAGNVNEVMIRQLHRGEFINRADNVVLIGKSGSTPRWTWSTCWSRKRPQARPGTWPKACSA